MVEQADTEGDTLGDRVADVEAKLAPLHNERGYGPLDRSRILITDPALMQQYRQ